MSFQAPYRLVVLLLLGLTACAKQEPFVEIPDLGKVSRSKALYERVTVCFSDGDSLETLKKLAGEECAKGQKAAHYVGYQRWQCRLMVPHQASFVCLEEGKALENKKSYLNKGETGLPAVQRNDEGADLFGGFGTFGFGK
jgi:hypothetical protein